MCDLLSKIKFEIKFILAKLYMCGKKFEVNILSIQETLDKIIEKKVSVIRFGDGEFSLIGKRDVCMFQEYSPQLQQGLVDALTNIKDERVLVCLPETMADITKFQKRSRKLWTINFAENYKAYRDNCDSEYVYGNAFLSRPYMIYEDKKLCTELFTKFINIFEDRDIVLIEGAYSRSGVGNDLFTKARSIKRIIAPSTNAYFKYQEIFNVAITMPKESLILIALGPTTKILANDLVKRGYWVLDIGHIDSEYEWFLRNSVKKEKISGKHSAEFVDEQYDECIDEDYQRSIVFRV